MNDTKLVITGVSSISSLGVGYNAMVSGLSCTPATTPVQSFEFHELDNEIPCFRIPGFDPVEILGKKGLRTKDLATKILLAAMELEFKERFDSDPVETKPGIAVGTSFGSVQSIGDFLSDSIVNGVNAVNPMLFANTVINSPTGNANIRYNVKTLSATISSGFNAGIDALIYACDHIRCGHCSAIVAGGLEELSYYTLMGMDRSGLLSKTDSIRPFSPDSKGTVMGEGCALFLIETQESAQAHGATIIAEIAGYDNAFDPHDGIPGFNPQGEGARHSIREALSMAHITPNEISFVASGGNGAPSGDTMESAVISAELENTPVTAYKARTGECYGASGALSCACAIADMKNNRICGTGSSYEVTNNVNLISETVENTQSEYALITSFSREGNCSSLILKNI